MKCLILFALLCMSFLSYPQEKYAVIISPYAPNTGYSKPNSWATANPTKGYLYEFWNDTYLAWETFYNHGFDDSKIFVLYNYGYDYTYDMPSYNERYFADRHNLSSITDYSAHKSNVDNVFTGLTVNIQEDDFLVVYILGHGGKSGIALPPFILDAGLSWVELQ